MKQRGPITSKSSNFKGETQRYVVKLPKSAGTRQYGPKIGARANLSPEFPTQFLVATYAPVKISCMKYYWLEEAWVKFTKLSLKTFSCPLDKKVEE